uniref:ubiquitinyl hydrolase 1 n=1 Tax=Myripristis murdjan TaxID=586833 RepID=A0A668A8C8_9TELE
MSGSHEHGRRRHPPKMFLIATDLKVQDQLDGTIRLQRGNICQEQDGGRSRGDQLWVKVLDNGIVIKLEKKILIEVPTDLSGLLEPVSDPESRLKLLRDPGKLQRLAALPLGTPLWVQMGQPDELAEAELKYRGPLTRGSSAVFFGVQLKGSAAGRGLSNGSYKGHQFFMCPEASALFLPASHVRLRRWSRSNGSDEHERAPPTPVHVREDAIHGGEVCFCGPLPGRTSSGMYVGVLLDAPVGNWDGYYKGEKLCHIPSHLYGELLPITKVSPVMLNPCVISAPSESKSHRHKLQNPKSILKPVQPPNSKLSPVLPPPSAPKVPLPLPPAPPPKPQTRASPTDTEQSQPSNGTHLSPSPLRSPANGEDAKVNGETRSEVELEVGSMVEVNDPPLFGVIRWIGRITGIPELVAGIELDHELTAGTDGSYLGERHFRCPANKGLFVKLRNCRRDSRFPAPETPVNQVERCNSIAFAEWGSERVEDHTPPVEGEEAVEIYQGCKRGIQGHLNSCYLDASLFSLFSCCSSADWVLLWPTDSQTDHHSSQAQDLLRCEIVNPLRRFGYVCASKTMALRRLLEAEYHDTGFTNQEKDPEEFLNKLFQLLRVEPLLKIRSMTQQPQECHLYQLFPPSLPPSPTSPCPLSPSFSPIPLSSPTAGKMRVASVQALLESSFLHAGLKFVEAPSCLLLLMPRFGKDFKMFDAILPTLSLDITDLLDDTLRQCSICQAVAEWECLQCYEDLDITPGRLKQYCQTCNTQVHSHKKRLSHHPGQVGVPGGPWTGPLHGTRQRLALFAVTCIETSHYVSFVKHGPRPTDWLFFDSMADREGGENGFNVPQVKACPEVGRYLSLSEDELSRVDPASLREPARRLLCDAYMCLYHSPELSLYK